MRPVVTRFLRYIAIDTQGNENACVCPSNENQKLLAELLKEELLEAGVSAEVDGKGFLYARLRSNIEDKKASSVAFIAHLDTNPDVRGEGIKPRIVNNYDGGEIVINERKNLKLAPETYPELLKHVGEDIIVSDGNTLLGADGKAGIAEIMEAVKYIAEHREIPHGDVYICFTPDEELGYSTEFISLDRLPADFGFTVEGGAEGEINAENFNAATATVTITGCGIHPGAAVSTMKNAILLAHKFISCFPESEIPENTERYEGYYHVSDISGSVEQCVMTWNIRDFDEKRYEERKKRIYDTAEYLNRHYGEGTFEADVEDYYLNIKNKLKAHPEILETARKAMIRAGVTPVEIPARGGTDGSVISFKGFPCPNIFSGEQNGFSLFEYISAQTMERSVATIVNIISLLGEEALKKSV